MYYVCYRTIPNYVLFKSTDSFPFGKVVTRAPNT